MAKPVVSGAAESPMTPASKIAKLRDEMEVAKAVGLAPSPAQWQAWIDLLAALPAAGQPETPQPEPETRVVNDDPDQFIVPHLLRELKPDCCCAVCEVLRESQEDMMRAGQPDTPHEQTWQPIETAPKGEWVLLHIREEVTVVMGFRDGDEWVDEQEQSCSPYEWAPAPASTSAAPSQAPQERKPETL